MKIRLNHPDEDKDGSLDHPTMDPAAQQKYANEDEAYEDLPTNDPEALSNDLRLDDLGTDDLHDVPRNQDLAAIDELTQDIGDRPLFDRSIENLEVGENDGVASTGQEDILDAGDARLPEREDQLPDEESQVYESSMDGPGTRDLH